MSSQWICTADRMYRVFDWSSDILDWSSDILDWSSDILESTLDTVWT